MQSLPVEWLPASIAPSNGDLEICVLGCDGIVRAFVFRATKMGPNGSMRQARSASTFNRRIGESGQSAAR